MPIVNFRNQRVQFPDEMSEEQIAEALKAIVKREKVSEIVERQEVVNQVSVKPWESQEAQVALSLLNDIKSASERPEANYTQDIKRISTLINECKPIKPEKPIDYSKALKDVADKLEVIANKEFPEPSDDSIKVLARIESLLSVIAKKDESIVIEAEKKERIQGFEVVRNSVGDARRFNLIYEGVE